ncbi:hypothetical protein JAAARDRAFT_154529 [Jaapia argillacea MUCL 33604]|uniref:Peptidase M48 domain-containing protein n=1 Tax=Jaapia argillacea MUCL 33604 TaxID=933084 RepID=A0A067PWN3_9AGAM|nr:hypothetical protein JAAARDRAFT_154529 [Jaapia argillacea MUCL 33604]
MVLRRLQRRNIVFHVLVFTPILLFWAAIVASLERTPLTGRWRLILLSPEEEDEISAQLAGPGWYHAVGEILAQPEPPHLLPQSDWRFIWVRDTLRHLESVVPLLQHEDALVPAWVDRGSSDLPFPPPAEYPLRPRPRGTEFLRRFCEVTSARPVHPVPHAIPGPPYSLIIVDKPDSSNAFSYGFGPDGGGGIVVYSGFLEEVLSSAGLQDSVESSLSPSPQNASWWRFILGIFSPASAPPASPPRPTPDQTAELAVLLSHELAHLVLSHHLETLSSATIVIPGILSMVADVVRALLFPVTMLFGPFVNDAVANLGKVGSGDLVKLGEYCTSMKQEIEADVVSARLLAHAGFDARRAVDFWETRQESSQTAECSLSTAEKKLGQRQGQTHTNYGRLAMLMAGSDHPQTEVRIGKLKGELERWGAERERMIKLSPPSRQ